MHQLQPYAPELHVGIGFCPKKLPLPLQNPQNDTTSQLNIQAASESNLLIQAMVAYSGDLLVFF
jgi:hypothetical protein